MNRYILLGINILLGIFYSWSGLFIAWLSAFIFAESDTEIFFIFIPLIFCFLTYKYFSNRKMGRLSAAGLIFGFIIGFFLIMLGLGLGGV